MGDKDIRWEQRFSNYQKALQQLKEAVDLMQTRELSNLEKQGMIQRFEFCYELAWKLMKAWLQYKGIEARTPRDCFREAFAVGLIIDGDGWMDMLVDRNLTSHTYDEEDARRITEKIEQEHYSRLAELIKQIEEHL